jgi:DNA-binding PadR family transcriptional regulator
MVLVELLQSRQEWRYGYDLSRNTGLKSGTLYPILMRLAEHRLVETCWETAEIGRPPRHMYKLTRAGLQYARAQASAVRLAALGEPALEGGRGV